MPTHALFLQETLATVLRQRPVAKTISPTADQRQRTNVVKLGSGTPFERQISESYVIDFELKRCKPRILRKEKAKKRTSLESFLVDFDQGKIDMLSLLLAIDQGLLFIGQNQSIKGATVVIGCWSSSITSPNWPEASWLTAKSRSTSR